MKTSILALAVSITCIISQKAIGQSSEHASTTGWGIEAELIAPFVPEVGIITIKATKTITGSLQNNIHGDLLLGVYLRPNVKHDIVEKINEYLLTVGYRQYFFKGFHVEAQLDAGYAWGTRNKIDGKDYNNFALLGEVNAGHILHLPSSKKSNLYILPQFGVLQGLSTDIGPRGGKADTFVQGKLSIGIRF